MQFFSTWTHDPNDHAAGGVAPPATRGICMRDACQPLAQTEPCTGIEPVFAILEIAGQPLAQQGIQPAFTSRSGHMLSILARFTPGMISSLGGSL